MIDLSILNDLLVTRIIMVLCVATGITIGALTQWPVNLAIVCIYAIYVAILTTRDLRQGMT